MVAGRLGALTALLVYSRILKFLDRGPLLNYEKAELKRFIPITQSENLLVLGLLTSRRG